MFSVIVVDTNEGSVSSYDGFEDEYEAACFANVRLTQGKRSWVVDEFGTIVYSPVG